MKTSHILHYAFRARDPENLGRFYADLFEGAYFVHPVMAGVGIVIVKINHPDALFNGLLEFWPWDIVWDGHAAVFRRVKPEPSPTSYGHLAVRVEAGEAEVIAELKRRGIPHRMEARSPTLSIPTIDDPEGNMIELFPRLDHMDFPRAMMVPRDQAAGVLAEMRRRFDVKAKGWPEGQGYSLGFMDG
jgi:hypothetical protein